MKRLTQITTEYIARMDEVDHNVYDLYDIHNRPICTVDRLPIKERCKEFLSCTNGYGNSIRLLGRREPAIDTFTRNGSEKKLSDERMKLPNYLVAYDTDEESRKAFHYPTKKQVKLVVGDHPVLSSIAIMQLVFDLERNDIRYLNNYYGSYEDLASQIGCSVSALKQCLLSRLNILRLAQLDILAECFDDAVRVELCDHARDQRRSGCVYPYNKSDLYTVGAVNNDREL